MIKCPKCGNENKDSVAFCSNCGYKLLDGSPVFSGAPGENEKKTSGETQFVSQQSAQTSLTLHNNRYEILEEIGSGGMGKIYLANDRYMESKVVVKEMLPLASTPEEKNIPELVRLS